MIHDEAQLEKKNINPQTGYTDEGPGNQQKTIPLERHFHKVHSWPGSGDRKNNDLRSLQTYPTTGSAELSKCEPCFMKQLCLITKCYCMNLLLVSYEKVIAIKVDCQVITAICTNI